MKLTPALPSDHGLRPIEEALVADPHQVHAVVALVDSKRTTLDADSGESEATLRIRRVEVIGGEDLAVVEKMIRRAIEKRSGATVLPLDLEDEISTTFATLKDVEGEG